MWDFVREWCRAMRSKKPIMVPPVEIALRMLDVLFLFFPCGILVDVYGFISNLYLWSRANGLRQWKKSSSE